MTFAFAEPGTEISDAITPQDDVMEVLVLCEDQSTGGAIAASFKAAGNVAVMVVQTSLAQHLGAGRENWARYDFVIFQTLPDCWEDLAAVRSLKSDAGLRLDCVAIVAGTLTLAQVREFAAAGVAEILPLSDYQPAATEVTRSAIAPDEPVNPLLIAKAVPGRVVAVLRSRGGAGASTLAVNLAAELAQVSGPDATVILDLDLQNGTVATRLDLPESALFATLLREGMHPDAAFLDAAIARHDSGLHVLPAPDVLAPLSSLTAENVARLLALLAARYDHVVVDLPNVVTDWLEPVLSAASRALIVTDTSVPGIKRSRRLIDLICEDHMTLPVSVVVNGEARPFFQSEAQKEAARVLGSPLDHWIPRDERAARRACATGKPLRQTAARSGMTRAIGKLAQVLAAQPVPAKEGK